MAVQRKPDAGKLADSPQDGQVSSILHVGERQQRAADGQTTISWSQPIGIIDPNRPVVAMNWHHIAVAPGGGGVPFISTIKITRSGTSLAAGPRRCRVSNGRAPG